MTLYDDLGIPGDASPGDIKKAYRRAAKKAHPDTGGSEHAFRALQRAYKTLSDPNRRSRYDSTGDETEDTPDNSYSEMLAVIAYHLEGLVQNAIKHNVNLLRENLVAVLQETMKQQIDQITQQISTEKKIVTRLRSLDGRFHCKEGPSTIDKVLRGHTLSHEHNITELERKKTAINAALELISNETFDIEKMPDGFGYGFPPLLGGSILGYAERMFGR